MAHLNPISNWQKYASPSPFTTLEDRISNRSAHIAVIGQGYVGFPLAVEFARASFLVTGIDTDRERVSSLNKCNSPTPDVTDEDLGVLSNEGSYQATLDFAMLDKSDVIIICVPTPLRKSKDPDISFVFKTAERITERLRPGQLIILESTTYPGTTEELLLPLFEERGYRAGRDFFLAFSPERIDPGNTKYRVKDIPKVTGGITQECTYLASLLYRQIVNKVVEVSSPKVAELAKLYENVFRSVNIALANEFALMCRHLGVNTHEVIEAAASKPFGFMAFYPGPGIGGHCIPIDPSYLAWKMRFNNYHARFIHLAEEINESMPDYVIQLVTEGLNRNKQCLNGSRLLLLGAAYKRGVGDTRESPSMHIMKTLLKKGAEVHYSDPYVPQIESDGKLLHSIEITDHEIEKADCVIILTDHVEFDYQRIVDNAKLVIDTRDATWGIASKKDHIVRL